MTIETPTFSHLMIMGWFGIIQLIISVRSWMKKGGGVINPYIFFLLALYIFSFGQSLLYSFKLISGRDLIGYLEITIPDVFNAQIYTLILLACFQIGANLAKEIIYTSHDNPVELVKQRKRLLIIGQVLFLISVIPYYQELIKNLVISVTYGYGAIYDQEVRIGINNISAIIGELFIPSLICMHVACKRNMYKIVIEILLLFNAIVILITGGRTRGVILLVLVLIMHNFFVRRFSKKMIIVLGVGAFFFLSILSYISTTRSGNNRQVSVEGLEISTNGAVDAIGEMGGSMFCLIESQKLVPEHEPFRYGESYLYSLTAVIPNLGFWEIHPAKLKANLSDWLTDTLDLSYGTGFSMVAEAYVNFGALGFLVFVLLGWLFASFFNQFNNIIGTENVVFCAFILIIFWFSLKLPRNCFIGFARPVVYYALPILWLSRGYIWKRKTN